MSSRNRSLSNERRDNKDRRDNSKDRRDNSRERDQKNAANSKRKDKQRNRSPQTDRKTRSGPDNRQQWSGQFRRPFPPPRMPHGAMIRPGFHRGPFMIGHSHFFPPYQDQQFQPCDDNFAFGYGYQSFDSQPMMPPPPPVREGPRYGENVLEKAENMVNELAQKRKQAEERNRRKPPGEGKSLLGQPKKDPAKSFSAGNSPRLTSDTWAMVTKDLPKPNREPMAKQKPTSTDASARERSPNRPAKSAPKPDVGKVATKSAVDSFSRASIAKLINAPRSHKERQRLASLVKKTKPKPIRPKLNVQAVPEVGAVDSNSPLEVNEFLDLVELPENLRRQVEHLLENGPDTGLQNRSPTKSPVAKRAKKNDEGSAEVTSSEPVRAREPRSPARVKIVEPVRKPDPPIIIKPEPTWETDSVISDVTSIGDEGGHPFDGMIDRVTSDPKLNRLLEPIERCVTPDESNLLATPRIEEMVHQALGTTPKREEKETFKRPEASGRSPKVSSPKTGGGKPPKSPRSGDRSSVAAPVTGPTETPRSEPDHEDYGNARPVASSPARNGSQKPPEASPSRDYRPQKPSPLDPGRIHSHILSSAADGISIATKKLRDMGDSLMSLHIAIHTPARQEETVNLVLDITEREEQLRAEVNALDAHTDILNQLISECRTELDRLVRLRATVDDDGEILRKQRLEVLRDAVSRKQKEHNVTSTQKGADQPVTSTSEPVELLIRDEDADVCSTETESIIDTPRTETTQSDDLTPRFDDATPRTEESTPRTEELTPRSEGETMTPRSDTTDGSQSDYTMHYVCSINLPSSRDAGQTLLDQIKNSPLQSTPNQQADVSPRSDVPFESLTIPTIESPDDFVDDPTPSPNTRNRKRKKPMLGVKMVPAKSKKQTAIKDMLLGKDSKKKKQQQSALLELCKSMSPVDMSPKRSTLRSLLDTPPSHDSDYDLPDLTPDDGTNDESELDSPVKVKARLLKAVESPTGKNRVQFGKLKNDLLQSLCAVDIQTSKDVDEIGDPLIQSKILDHEISLKLHECSVVLNRLQENKKKNEAVSPKRSPARATEQTATVSSTAEADPESISIVSDNLTNSEVSSSKDDQAPKRRRSRRRTTEKARAPPVGYSSTSEYDTDDVSTRESAKPTKFPSDSRKEKLRQMGVILSASELEDYCKDGHQLSETESTVDTPRTEDLVSDAGQTLDTARTEDLLQPIVPVKPGTPFDDSDNYSSCLESIDEDSKPLRSTGDSASMAESSQCAKSLPEYVPSLAITGDSTMDSDYESKSREKPDTARTDDSIKTDRSVTSVLSEDLSGRYTERIKRILCETTDTETEPDKNVVNIKPEPGEDDDDVVIMGESRSPPMEPPSDPSSARSDKSLPAYGHQKQKFVGHSSAVTSMIIHGDHLYTCSPQDSLIRKFHVETAECVHVFKGDALNIYTMLAIDHDGKSYLYTGGYDCKLVKYDLNTHLCLSTQVLAAKIRCLVTRWDRVFVGLCSGEILSLNPETDSHKSLVASGKSVSCMDTGSEGSRQILVVGSFDPLISIHDAKNGLLLRTIRSHARVPLSVKTFHNMIFSAGADKSLKQHDLNSGELLKSIQLHHPVTDLMIFESHLYVACFDGMIRCFTRDLELKRLYYGAGKNYILRLGERNGRLYSTNKNGCVESMAIVDDLFMCRSKNCRLGFGLATDLEYHVTERHVVSRVDNNTHVYYCTWSGCCFETSKRMDLENHLLNHVENQVNEDDDN